MSERKIRIGFVGVGGMGQMAHLRNYVLLDDCEVTAIAELRDDVRERVAEKYAVPGRYRTASDMLASEKLDALVASQPFTRHGIILSEILGAGIPVFTEKPIASSIEVGERIVEQVGESGTFIMVGYHKRSDPATIYAKSLISELLQTGELGKMTYVRLLMPAGDWIASGFDEMVRGTGEPPALEFDPPAQDMDKATYDSYLAFVNYYIHQVNLLRHLMGPYRPVFADRAGYLLVAETGEETMAETQDRVTGVIEMSPYRTTVDWQEQALVCFERGWIRIDLPAPVALNRPGTVTIYSDPDDGETPRTISPTLPWIHAMRQQARNFVDAVRGKMPPMTTAEEALEDLRVAREYLRLYSRE